MRSGSRPAGTIGGFACRMQPPEFDQFADEYEALHRAGLGASGEGPEYFAEYKLREIHRTLARAAGGQAPRVAQALDFGCGVGNSIAWFRHYFGQAPLLGLDVSARSLDIARQRYPGEQLALFDGERIALADGTVDLAYAMCVFHHIPASQHGALLRELLRVLRPGGRLFVFEHNPLNPLTVRVVNDCPFDANAVLIRAGVLRQRLIDAGFARAATHYRVFFPRALRALRPLEPWLGWLPLGGQYFACGVRPGAGA